MTGMTGLVTELKKAGVKVVLLSPGCIDPDKRKGDNTYNETLAKYAVRLGAKDFLMKPVMPDTLLATLEKALKQSC